jgi:hypothetical protein
MDAKITEFEKDYCKIKWEKEDVGFGEIIIKPDKKTNGYVIDPEFMGLSFVLDAINIAMNTEKKIKGGRLSEQ